MVKRNVLIAVASLVVMSVPTLVRAESGPVQQFVGGHEPARMFQPAYSNRNYAPYALTGQTSVGRDQINSVQIGSRIVVTGVTRN